MESRYMTKEALKTVAKLFGEATHLTEVYLEALQTELEMLTGGESALDGSRGLQPLVPNAYIRDKLSRPLSEFWLLSVVARPLPPSVVEGAMLTQSPNDCR
jgi:hypothetical protein